MRLDLKQNAGDSVSKKSSILFSDSLQLAQAGREIATARSKCNRRERNVRRNSIEGEKKGVQKMYLPISGYDKTKILLS